MDGVCHDSRGRVGLASSVVVVVRKCRAHGCRLVRNRKEGRKTNFITAVKYFVQPLIIVTFSNNI